ncbi:hypothetical protein OE88DRAFT_1735868 [Heliocybe sulcata]|uniref:HAD-like protein n=1 Tax=Heliocybe sulcata TaxID=5364 RepID=A0A5C3MZC1_9AGAM|nr:hypothetical protein OE88DRAFT_1735868 [Heliocybe sulcata]
MTYEFTEIAGRNVSFTGDQDRNSVVDSLERRGHFRAVRVDQMIVSKHGIRGLATPSLASFDVLCADKTGTLKADQLSVNELCAAGCVDLNCMLTSSQNSKALGAIQIKTAALISLAAGSGDAARLVDDALAQAVRPVSKPISTDVVLGLADANQELHESYKQRTQEFAKSGLMVFGWRDRSRETSGKSWRCCLCIFDAPHSDTAQVDCGIAVEGATDVLDGEFLNEVLSTITTPVQVARQIFHRMGG